MMASENKCDKLLLQEAFKMMDKEDYELLSKQNTLEMVKDAMERLGEALQPLTKFGQDFMIKKLCRQILKIDIEEIGASEIEFKKVRDDAFKSLDKDDHDKLKRNPDVLTDAEIAMKKTYGELKHMMRNSKSLDQALEHLPKWRQERIKTSLRLQSFKVDIKCETDENIHLMFASLQGEPLSFLPSYVTLTDVNYAENRTLLVARIVLEIIILLLDLIGLGINLGEEALKAAIERIKLMLESADSIIEDVNAMIEAEKEGNLPVLAKAIVKCMVDLIKQHTAFFDVVKILLSDMLWYYIYISVAKVAVVTIIATDGLAEIAEILNFLLVASDFVSKLKELNDLNRLKQAK